MLRIPGCVGGCHWSGDYMRHGGQGGVFGIWDWGRSGIGEMDECGGIVWKGREFDDEPYVH